MDRSYAVYMLGTHIAVYFTENTAHIVERTLVRKCKKLNLRIKARPTNHSKT